MRNNELKKPLKKNLSPAFNNVNKGANIEARRIGEDEQGRALYMVIRYTSEGFQRNVRQFEVTHDVEGAKQRLLNGETNEEKIGKSAVKVPVKGAVANPDKEG